MKMMEELIEEDSLLLVRVDNVKNLSLPLKAVNFKDTGVCFATEYGLKIVVEDWKCVQANAFIGNDIFQEYVIKEESVVFRIDLSTLVECLTIFDGCSTSASVTTALKLTYKAEGQPVKVILDEDGVITDCSLKTMNDCDVLDFEMSTSDILAKVIVQAADFKEVFFDLDSSSEFIEFFLSPNPPYFCITTIGISGKCEIVIQKDSDTVETFECMKEARTRYRYSQLKPSLKCLAVSSKVSIRTNKEGLLCFQFMIQTESKQFCYVEYYCAAVIDEESPDM